MKHEVFEKIVMFDPVGPVSEIVAWLQEFLDDPTYRNVCVTEEWHVDEPSEYHVTGTRDMTPGEISKEETKERKAREKRKAEKQARLERDRKQYERLHKRFGG